MKGNVLVIVALLETFMLPHTSGVNLGDVAYAFVCLNNCRMSLELLPFCSFFVTVLTVST